MSTRIWRGVTLQLFLVAVLPLTVLVLAVTFGSLRLHHQAMRSLVADRNMRAVQSAAASLSNEIDHRGKTLELLSREMAPDEPAADALARVEKDLAVFDGGVAAIDADGTPAAMDGSPAIAELVKSPEWPQIQNAVRTSPAGTAQYLPVRAIDSELFVPVLVSGVAKTALIGLFSSEALLADGLAVVSNEEPVTIVVVDQDYQVLFRSGSLSSGENLATHPGIKNALADSRGIDYLQTGDGEHVITTSTIQPVGWALMIEESWEDIASPLLRLTQNAPLIIIPILGLSLLALWFGLRQIVEPMQALESKASDLARGDFETIRQPVGGVPEIRHLQGALIDMAGKLKEAQSSLHSYIGAITDSVESERRSLARELHDDTLQSLIALSQYNQYAIHWNKDPKVEKSLNQMLDLAEQGMKNLRRMVQGLRPIYIEDLGLATALAMQVNDAERSDEVQIHFQQEGNPRRLQPEVEMALYRIAQEALSNVRRHSGARNAWISLHFREDSVVVLEIRDDGQGFVLPSDPIYYARQGHYGMLGLYERSELIGAKLTIRSSPGEGTQILVRLLAPNEPVRAEVGG